MPSSHPPSPVYQRFAALFNRNIRLNTILENSGRVARRDVGLGHSSKWPNVDAVTLGQRTAPATRSVISWRRTPAEHRSTFQRTTLFMDELHGEGRIQDNGPIRKIRSGLSRRPDARDRRNHPQARSKHPASSFCTHNAPTSHNALQPIIQKAIDFRELIGRSGRIRTCDPLVPNQMRYQAALRSADNAGRNTRFAAMLQHGYGDISSIFERLRCQIKNCRWRVTGPAPKSAPTLPG